MTPKELRQKGYKLRITHERAGILPSCEISPTWGATEVEVLTPEGKIFKGRAECSVRDSFNKKIGTKIALGRALRGKSFGEKYAEIMGMGQHLSAGSR